MAETPWTAGPWNTDRSGIYAADGRVLFVAITQHVGIQEAKSNTIVAAAAPDLYEALETMVEDMIFALGPEANEHQGVLEARVALLKANPQRTAENAR